MIVINLAFILKWGEHSNVRPHNFTNQGVVPLVGTVQKFLFLLCSTNQKNIMNKMSPEERLIQWLKIFFAIIALIELTYIAIKI